MSTPKTSPAGRTTWRPGVKLLLVLVGLFLLQVQLPIGHLLTALATAATHPIGLAIAAALTAAYLYFTKGTRRR